jgi:hypothetical protein
MVTVVRMPDLVMTSGTAVSQAMAIFDDAKSITIYAPGTITSTSVLVEIEPSSTGSAWVVLQSGAIDVEIPAGKGTVFMPGAWPQLRLHGNTNEAVTRRFPVTKVIEV